MSGWALTNFPNKDYSLLCMKKEDSREFTLSII
jgi:hypothetical protein